MIFSRNIQYRLPGRLVISDYRSVYVIIESNTLTQFLCVWAGNPSIEPDWSLLPAGYQIQKVEAMVPMHIDVPAIGENIVFGPDPENLWTFYKMTSENRSI